MFGLSIEHFLIAGAVLLFFGPKRLPEIGSGMGKAIRNFKRTFSGQDEEKEEVAKLEAPEDKDKSKKS